MPLGLGAATRMHKKRNFWFYYTHKVCAQNGTSVIRACKRTKKANLYSSYMRHYSSQKCTQKYIFEGSVLGVVRRHELCILHGCDHAIESIQLTSTGISWLAYQMVSNALYIVHV